MYSLLITSIAALQGGEERLVEQLTDEFRVDLRGMIEGDREPGEEELRDAIGGEENLGLLRKFFFFSLI